MALAVSYFTTITTGISSSTALYTTASSGYYRDLVVANGSTTPIFVSAGAAAASATSTASFGIPAGQSVCLMGQVPTSTILYATTGAGTANSISLGWASVVSVI